MKYLGYSPGGPHRICNAHVDWVEHSFSDQQKLCTQQVIENTDRLYEVIVEFAQQATNDQQALLATAAAMHQLSCKLDALIAWATQLHCWYEHDERVRADYVPIGPEWPKMPPTYQDW